ncbi:Rrf2 family transcriptional regulator [Chryseobacterium sp. Leaf201]|uniref:Rrf2 family transcriptional regulator n=1 Tax=Chryseobacterium sp. Leaf201 TaxID=1735672 RepID=UPI0006F88468|nr:Rrf2 family transcriptional regulator [Chryseobacterium sp. Leaf201]KQM50403.1 Rrf2 family transcriptional regulator [Chryseobacterium sp. Leaf201]
MSNTRFATAVHIMTLLADSPQDWLTSEWMAGSININPVMVRKELSVLREAGLVISRQGKEGGSQLSRNAEAITIAEIYAAVKNTDVLGKKNQKLNPLCPVGKEINNHLNDLFKETDQLVIQFLGNKTLKEFTDHFS